MNNFLNSIPAAATSEFALVAYAIAAILFIIAGAKLQMAKLTFARIELLPESERRRALEIATGNVLPTHVTADQWIRHERQKWTFLLIGAVLIALMTVVTIALVNPTSRDITNLETTVVKQAQQLRLDVWRDRYEIGQVSGYAAIAVDLTQGNSKQELAPWLNRVEDRYRTLKSATDPNSRAVRGVAEGYIEINSLTSPKWNWDLIPRGEQEKLPDELFFNSRFHMLATGGEKRGLLLAPLSFEAKASSVKIYIDPVTQNATRIEGSAEGSGRFSPIPGQFTHWLDFYGATLIARQKFTVDPESDVFDSLTYESITFNAKSDQWNKSATFAGYTGADLYTDSKRSLIVQNADWRTLENLPGDYPGQRLDVHGPVPGKW